MRSFIPLVFFFSSISLLSTGCNKSPPADKPDAGTASEVVLNVPGLT